MCAKGLINISVILCWLCVCLLAEEQQHHKRVPSGFTGVRGKKSIYAEEPPPEGDDVHNNGVSGSAEGTIVLDKRAPSGFMGMRGKKPSWAGTYPDGGDGTYYYKRAPAGFMGMRGKKDMELTNYGEEYLKRAPAGFFGMRGKKDYTDQDYVAEKRAPMGFVGMRGKKDDQEEAKRAPAGFFGMRGKKHPRQSGFFGMRGKKYPYEFRGKFVGVRGKKSDDYFYNNVNNNDDLMDLTKDLDLNQLMLLLSEGDNNNNGAGEWNGSENDGSIISQQN